ncbi:MAG: hypothetical protein LAO77_25625 [Acidobacteriia bacterium]|nr:hypothetical protein [Terriglobia bacterium]
MQRREIAIALQWEQRGLSPTTGDEPHYLIIADAVSHDGRLAVGGAYGRDAFIGKIAGPIDWWNHTVSGPRGVFSVHDIGLPIVVAPVFARFGVSGVRILMGAIAGLIPLIGFRIARLRGLGFNEAIALSVCTSFSLPFLAAGGQIYPDLVTGVILLALTTMTLALTDRGMPIWTLALTGVVLAVLPWLHIKNVLPALTLGATLAFVEYSRAWGGAVVRRLAWLATPAIASGLLLSWYNHVAFGHILGPYTEQTAAGATGRQAAMIFLGLHLDQAQGVFVQQPLFLLGLLGLGLLARRSPTLAVGLCFTYLAAIVPNSFHPCWYGCHSISGRFMWSVAPLWIVPVVFVYAGLAPRGRRVMLIMCSIGVVSQILLLQRWRPGGPGRLYLVFAKDLLKRDSLFDAGWRPWLPSFYDFDRYATYAPNLIAMAVAAALIALGLVWARGAARENS